MFVKGRQNLEGDRMNFQHITFEPNDQSDVLLLVQPGHGFLLVRGGMSLPRG